MIYGSVCSGIEAATVAWQPLGWKAAFYSEIEAFPRAVLRHRYPETPLHGDFTTIKAGEYADINVLVGGTPCQSFSIAGLRGGLADDRGNLALEYLRLAQRLRPRWLVWENVPGVLSSNGGRDFGSILGGMGELGYGFAYRVLDAQYVRVDGFERAVPQRRRRVFVVGYLGDWRRAAAVLFERESLRWDSPPSRETRQDVAPTISARTRGGGGLGTDFDCDGGLIHFQGRGTNLEFGRDVAGTLGTTIDRASGVAPCVAMTLNAKGGVGRLDYESETLITQHGGVFDVLAFDETQITSKTNRSKPQINSASHTLAKGARAPAIAFTCKDHGADASEDIAPTLRSMGHAQSHANAGGQVAIAFNARQDPIHEIEGCPPLDTDGGTNAVMQTAAARRLTPRECERLMGFPDDYTLIPYRGKSAADGPRYKAIGNSMATNCMRLIGRRIELVEALP